MNTEAQYNFIQKHFIYDGQNYNVVLSAEFCWEEDGLDFTGSYVGILISPAYGTYPFHLTPDLENKWQMDTLSTHEPSSVSHQIFLHEVSETLDLPGKVPIKVINGLNDQGIIDELDRIIQKSLKGSR